MGKNFQFWDFRFKIRFETFWIDCDKNIFFDFFRFFAFLTVLIIFGKSPKIVKKWLSPKILVEKFFWSESIQNVSKRILNQKPRNRTFFPCQTFFVGLSRFPAKMTKNVKKWLSHKILVEKFLWPESIQNGLKRISERKSRNQNFLPCKFFART